MTKRPVVLVEGDPAMRGLLTLVLQRCGMAVLPIADGAALQQHLGEQPDRSESPAMLVADVDQPGGVGLRTLRLVRELWPELPIVLITAFGDTGASDRARLIGALGVLEKPFDLLELRRIVLQRAHEPGRPNGSGTSDGSSEAAGAA